MSANNTKVQLNTGTWVDAEVAIYDYAWLKHTSLHFPDVFFVATESALGSIVPKPEWLSDNLVDKIRTQLVDESILDSDFGIDPTLRQVLLASYRNGPDGCIMENPFQIATHEHIAYLNDIANEEGSGIQGLLD